MLSSLATAAGLTRQRKKFHFDVHFSLEELLNCTYLTGVIFAKIRLRDGGTYSVISDRFVLRVPFLPSISPITAILLHSLQLRCKGSLCQVEPDLQLPFQDVCQSYYRRIRALLL